MPDIVLRPRDANFGTYDVRAFSAFRSGLSVWLSPSNSARQLEVDLTRILAQAIPTVVLNTADAFAFTDTTPSLEFTGSDVNGDSIRYNIQVSDNAGFVGSATVDSYSESNQDQEDRLGLEDIGNGINSRCAQSFNSGAGGELDSAKFYLRKGAGSPTGNAVAKIYAHSGIFGTSSVPTGTALATSDNFDVSTLTGSLALVTFTFSGAERIALTASTNYCVSVEYGGGDASNRLSVGDDGSSPTHGGNTARYTSGVWVAVVTTDLCFYVITSGFLIDKVSGTDLGFANTISPGDTDPFNAGDKISYTVQTVLDLDATYYWRARATDPLGADTYSPWTTARTFTITSGTDTYSGRGIGRGIARGIMRTLIFFLIYLTLQ